MQPTMVSKGATVPLGLVHCDPTNTAVSYRILILDVYRVIPRVSTNVGSLRSDIDTSYRRYLSESYRLSISDVQPGDLKEKMFGIVTLPVSTLQLSACGIGTELAAPRWPEALGIFFKKSNVLRQKRQYLTKRKVVDKVCLASADAVRER